MKEIASDTPLVGLVVEGSTEYQAIPDLIRRLGIRCTSPSSFNGQPEQASLDTVVKRLLPHVRVQLTKRPQKVFVILDLEERDFEAADFQSQLQAMLREEVTSRDDEDWAKKVEVIVCKRKFENWLLADPEGIRRSSYLRQNPANKVKCHADERDALAILKAIFCKDMSYTKATHGPRLAELLRVDDPEIHLGSESLRRFVESLRAFPERSNKI